MDWSHRLTRSSQHLLGHAVRFTRELRSAGVTVSPAQTAVFAESLSLVNLLEPREFCDAARLTLISKREDLARFEAAFTKFWRDLGLGGAGRVAEQPALAATEETQSAPRRGTRHGRTKSKGRQCQAANGD